jgi:hypothetical protein
MGKIQRMRKWHVGCNLACLVNQHAFNVGDVITGAWPTQPGHVGLCVKMWMENAIISHSRHFGDKILYYSTGGMVFWV